MSRGKEKYSLHAEAYVRCIRVSPDGKCLALGLDSGAICILDIATGMEKQRLQAGDKVGAIAWDPKGRGLVAALAVAKKIKAWDLESGQEKFSVDMKAVIPSLAFHPDGKQFAAAGHGSDIDFRDAEKGTVVRTIRTKGQGRVADIASHTVGEEILPHDDRSSFSGPALRCDVEGRQLAGFLHDESPADLHRIQHSTAWLARLVPGGPRLPVRVVFETHYFGHGTAYLTDLTSGDTPATPSPGAMR